MKKAILTITSGLFLTINSFGQCCPYLDGIEIIPSNPSDTDSLYLVTNVTTPNAGSYLGYTILESGNDIRVEACYYSGMLTVLQSYTDTINLGLKAGGDYNITFVAYLSGNDVTCDYSDSTQVDTTVTITSTAGYEPVWAGSVGLYPVPVANGMLFLTTGALPEDALRYELLNAQGTVIVEGFPAATEAINVDGLHGIYYLRLYYEDEFVTRKVLIIS